MRVGDFSGSFSGFGSGSESEKRKQRFRQQHSLGQEVEGRLLRQENSQLAWVSVDGHELLAAVSDPGPPGTILRFRIIQLVPDIVLQHMSASLDNGPSLERSTREFGRSRDRLAALARTRLPEQARTPARRRDAFLQLLETDQEIRSLHEEHRHHLGMLNLALADKGAGMVLSLPWLLPQALDQELFIHGDPARHERDGSQDTTDTDRLLDVTYSFTLPVLGHVRARILVSKDTLRYRLFMEHPDKGGMLTTLIRDLLADLEHSIPEPECLGISPLGPGPRSMLAAYLHPREQRLFTGLNRRV